MVAQNIEDDNELFVSSVTEAVAYVALKRVPWLFLSRAEEKVRLLSYLNYLEGQRSIKVVILRNPNDSPDRTEYLRLLDSWTRSKIRTDAILKAHWALNQIVVNIVESSKLFIWVESGKVPLPFFSLGLSCDYRIAADNLVVENPAPTAGLVPDGAAAFFLSRILGPARSLDILLSSKDISAYELLRLGLVDKVQPYNRLKDVALETAKGFACKPLTAIFGTKKLVNHSYRNLREYLEFEGDQLIEILNLLGPDRNSRF